MSRTHHHKNKLPFVKPAYFVVFLFTCCDAFSQTMTIEGTVTDKLTKEPLAFVNVYLSGTNFGTVTNQSGNFIFKYPSSLKDDTLRFSHLGYKPIDKVLREVDNYMLITLDPQTVNLNEIVIKPPDALEIVDNAIRKISENYNFNSHTVHGFQREHVNHKSEILQLLEADFDTRSFGRENGQFSIVHDGRYVEDKREKAPFWNPSRGGFYTFGWTTISGIENPSQKTFLGVDIKRKGDLEKYYDLQLKESVFSDAMELYVVQFDQKKNVRRPLLTGTLYIDSSSGAIVKLAYELSPRGLKHLRPHETWGGKKISKHPKRIDIRSDKYEITYRKFGTKWYLNTMVLDAQFEASLVFFGIVQSQKSLLQFHSERIVTAIDTMALQVDHVNSNVEDIGSIPTLQNFIKKHFENYGQSNDEKWSGANIIKSDTSFASIAGQLEKNNRIWESENKRRIAENILVRSDYTFRKLNSDLAFLKESIEQIHPGLYWYSDKQMIDNEFKAAHQGIRKRGTEDDFFHLLGPLIEKIHCGHTELNPSLFKEDLQKNYGPQFPLDTWVSGDSMVVTSSYAKIAKGSMVMEINGHRTSEIIEHIKATVPADGYNITYKEFQIRSNFPELFTKYYYGRDTFNVTIKDMNGNLTKLTIAGSKETDVEQTDRTNGSFSIIDSLSTGLLTVPSFSAVNDFPTFLEEAFEDLRQESINNLILDLRNNKGGRDEFGLLLFSYLARHPFKYYRNISVATIDTAILGRLSFGEISFNSAIPDYVSNIKEDSGSYYYKTHSNLGLHTPKETAFKGNVYILVNGGTFSTAAELASVAHANRSAFVIGEETGGGYYGNCSLGTPILTLPNSKLRISIPLARYELAVSDSAPIGHGLIPDFQTRYYTQDILLNKDKDLETVRNMITSREKVKFETFEQSHKCGRN